MPPLESISFNKFFPEKELLQLALCMPAAVVFVFFKENPKTLKIDGIGLCLAKFMIQNFLTGCNVRILSPPFSFVDEGKGAHRYL